VYQIVQAHEGKVWARSRLAEGTTFVLRLRRLGFGLPQPATVDPAKKALAVASLEPGLESAAVAGGRANG